MDLESIPDGADRFAAYMEELTGVIGHADHAVPLCDHCVGLLAAAGRKSVKPPDLTVPCWYRQGLLRGITRPRSRRR
jgi:hypothetical protein